MARNRLNTLIEFGIVEEKIKTPYLRDVNEALRKKIIFEACRNPQIDISDVVIDGKFNLIKLIEDVTNATITAEEMYEIILDGLENSVSNLIYELICEKFRALKENSNLVDELLSENLDIITKKED